MAEGLLRKLLREAGFHDRIVVESAGTFPTEGSHASSDSIETAAEAGIDLRGHAARSLGPRLVARADVILVMAPEHVDRILDFYPEAEGKTYLLTIFGDPEGDPLGVPDPIGLGPEVYRTTFRQIEAALRAALPRILAMVPEESEPPAGGGPRGGRGRGE
jgi:protein-tyrosine-phosphatase